MSLFPVFFNHRLIYKIYKILFLSSSKTTKADFLINLFSPLTFIVLVFFRLYIHILQFLPIFKACRSHLSCTQSKAE